MQLTLTTTMSNTIGQWLTIATGLYSLWVGYMECAFCFSKRKINDFLSMISGFQTSIKMANKFTEEDSLCDR